VRTDLASDARAAAPPPWLRSRLGRALDRLGTPPDPAAATRAAASRHGRSADEVLLTAGAGEALVLLARALQPRRAVCVHPATPRAETAVRAAGHPVERLVLAPPHRLDPEAVPHDADLVVLANPADPTGVLHERLEALCRPGRTVVVDESWADAVPGETASLAGRSDLPGLVVVRDLSATWSLPGLPAGYLLAEADLVGRLRTAQGPQAVSAPVLVALETCLARGPVRAAEKEAAGLVERRARLEQALRERGVDVVADSQAPFLLCRVPGRGDLPAALQPHGVVVRPVDDVPGLTAEHWRASVVVDDEASDLLLAALGELLQAPGDSGP
jgi:histidinol-phosphate aminotransferase